MKVVQYLIVDSQTGNCRIRKNPATTLMEYVFQLVIEIPETPTTHIEIKIPIPAAPAVVTEVKQLKFGIPWAVSEDILEVKGLDAEGKVILDYTDEGLKRLVSESKCSERYDIFDWAKRSWGVGFIYINPERLDPLLKENQQKEQEENED